MRRDSIMVPVPAKRRLKNYLDYKRRTYASKLLDKDAKVQDLIDFGKRYGKENAITIDTPFVEVSGGLKAPDGSWSLLDADGKLNFVICVTTQRLLDFGTFY